MNCLDFFFLFLRSCVVSSQSLLLFIASVCFVERNLRKPLNAYDNKLHRLYTLKPGKEKENNERKKNRITNLVSSDEEANKIREHEVIGALGTNA